jgi:hypothetical protein
MRATRIFLTVVLLAACSPSDADESTTSTIVTTTTAPTTTTITINPAAIAADTCDALKVAAFDLDSAITRDLEGLGLESESDLGDAEVGRVVVAGLVGFYDQLALIAEMAPDEVAGALDVVSESFDPWRDALTADAPIGALDDLDPTALSTPELEEATATVAGWTETACGSMIAVGPEEIMFTTVFAAMFGAFGSLFDGFSEGLSDEGEVVEGSDTALAYGDDAVLDDLYSRCGTGDGQACRDLYFSAFGEYELWGQTCGAAIPLRPAFVVDCSGKFGSTANAYGEDFVLDSLWDECEAGDSDSCDGLFAASGFGTIYEEFGASCGGTRPGGDATVPCTFLMTGEAYGYGDDPGLDLLWDACSVGDSVACDDLFFQTPIASAYEAFGRVCGDLAATARSCANVAEWLDGPVS